MEISIRRTLGPDGKIPDIESACTKKPCKKIIKWHVLVVKSGETQENSPQKLLKYKPNSGSLIKLPVD
ncbi:hypothetical protein ACSAZK_01175 [Methanosarcina sp. Mfa9]|uniref:hypothetical protein n=1 Tax=Methanosarcina sp. Mfa9 TaxID=3439063 RepID=UPI003F85DB34